MFVEDAEQVLSVAWLVGLDELLEQARAHVRLEGLELREILHSTEQSHDGIGIGLAYLLSGG